jgi:F420-non-reducing hydrogenase small subunit
MKTLRGFLQKPHFTPGEPIDKMHCLLEQDILCMGSVTKAGCGGDSVNPRCISARAPCRGCYGPVRHEGNQRLEMLNALASNGIDINSLPESTSMLRFSSGHQLLQPVKEA